MALSLRTAAVVLATVATVAPASAQRTPLMGWSSWNTYGLDINEQLIKEQERQLGKY